MARARHYIVLVGSLLLISSTSMAEKANTTEQLIKNIVVSARTGDTSQFLDCLTTGSRNAVDEWLKTRASLRQAQENFLEVLNKQFPESKPNAVPSSADLKSVFDLVSSLELMSAKEEPDGTALLVVKTTLQTPEGRTISRGDTFLARREEGEWKLKIDPGPVDRMLAEKAALEQVTTAVQNHEFRDRASAFLELGRVRLPEAPRRPEMGSALGSKDQFQGKLLWQPGVAVTVPSRRDDKRP
jgi:hypothetical protein